MLLFNVKRRIFSDHHVQYSNMGWVMLYGAFQAFLSNFSLVELLARRLPAFDFLRKNFSVKNKLGFPQISPPSGGNFHFDRKSRVILFLA